MIDCNPSSRLLVAPSARRWFSESYFLLPLQAKIYPSLGIQNHISERGLELKLRFFAQLCSNFSSVTFFNTFGITSASIVGPNLNTKISQNALEICINTTSHLHFVFISIRSSVFFQKTLPTTSKVLVLLLIVQ